MSKVLCIEEVRRDEIVINNEVTILLALYCNVKDRSYFICLTCGSLCMIYPHTYRSYRRAVRKYESILREITRGDIRDLYVSLFLHIALQDPTAN